MCSQLCNNTHYSISSVAPLRQLFRCSSTKLFIVALMGIYQQAPSQVLGFLGGYTFSRGHYFCLYYTF